MELEIEKEVSCLSKEVAYLAKIDSLRNDIKQAWADGDAEKVDFLNGLIKRAFKNYHAWCKRHNTIPVE